jgi:hypothetical protein
MKLLVGTPAYGGWVHIDYTDSLLDMHRLKIPFDNMKIGNESLITRGRNTIISYFYEVKDYTHLLFLDADMGIRGEDVIKLIQHNVDVIGAPVALKGYDQNGNKVYNVVNPRPCTKKLYEVDKVGTAVFMLSRKAVNALISGSEKYEGNELSRGNLKITTMYDVFKTCVEDGVYLSEDYYVCKRLRELGFKIHVDDTIITKHNGMFQF